MIEDLLRQCGVETERVADLAGDLAPLTELRAPAPSPELLAVFAGASAPPRRVGRLVTHPRRTLAGVVVLAVSTVGATGLSAAANSLPSSWQRHVSTFSRHYLPFDFPSPRERSRTRGAEPARGEPTRATALAPTAVNGAVDLAVAERRLGEAQAEPAPRRSTYAVTRPVTRPDAAAATRPARSRQTGAPAQVADPAAGPQDTTPAPDEKHRPPRGPQDRGARGAGGDRSGNGSTRGRGGSAGKPSPGGGGGAAVAPPGEDSRHGRTDGSTGANQGGPPPGDPADVPGKGPRPDPGPTSGPAPVEPPVGGPAGLPLPPDLVD